MHKPTALFALATFAAPTLADGTATWLYHVTTQNGDAIVEPGETATVTLSMEMTPFDPGVPLNWLANVRFDTIGDDLADMGHIRSWDILSGLDNVVGDETTTDGVSLFGTLVFQYHQHYVTDNPIDVLEFTWSPVERGDYVVGYSTTSETLDHVPGHVVVNVGEDMFEHWPVTEAAIAFTVVPAPASMLPLLLLARRRRACRPTEPRPSGSGHAGSVAAHQPFAEAPQ
jgi:hypothetical protein